MTQMMKGLEPKLTKFGKITLYYGLAIISILKAIDYFNASWDLNRFIGPGFVIIASVVVLFEIGFINGIKKKDFFKIGGLIVASLAMLGAVIEAFGLDGWPWLDGIKGIILGLLAIYFVIEGWR